jgi:hypothetical protein
VQSGGMLQDWLHKFLKKPTASSEADKPMQPVSPPSKNTSQKKTKKSDSMQDKLVLGGLMVCGVLFYFWMNAPEEPDGQVTLESVIPLAQLTGKIGAQPKEETLEEQFRRENKNVPLSDGRDIPPDVIKEHTRLFRQVPFGDTELSYEMRLPTNWGQSRFTQYGSPGEERYKVLTNIDRFFGPAIEDKRPFVWLEVERLSRMTTAENYMNQYFIQRGITPEAVKVHNMNRAEALFIQPRDYSSYAIRAVFMINGDRIMLATFGVPLEAYKIYRDLMGLAMSSVQMLETINRQPEPVSTYKLLNVLTFDYPSRWLLRNENRTSSLKPSMELALPTELNVRNTSGFGLSNQIDGLILVNAWRKTSTFSRATLEETIIKRLQVNQIKLQAVLQPEKQLLSHDDIASIKQTIYVSYVDNTPPTTEEFGVIQSTAAKPQQEVWVTTFDNGDYMVAVTLITWPQTKNYPNWSYNVTSYTKIVETMKIRMSVY